jgi:hypothetical protein
MKKDDKRSELIDAIGELKIADEVVEFTGDDKFAILESVKQKFVAGNPRVWWLSFKERARNFVFDDEFQYKRIVNFFNNDDICYFITELDDLYVFKTSIKNIISIIDVCSFFEYYVIDTDLTSLLCETDHGDLLFINGGVD